MPLDSPLSDVRVLNVGSGIAAPIAAMLLSDLGAQVIHIAHEQRPDSDAHQSVWDAFTQRNALVLQCSLQEQGIADLLSGSDIVITTNDSDALALGLDLESPHQQSTGLIHLHMPPVVDTSRLDAITIDAFTAAHLGIARRQSSFSGGPVETPFAYLSYLHGAWAATCAIAALVARLRDGCGQTVVVDSLHGALAAVGPHIVVDPEAPETITAVGPGGPNPTYTTYACADGQRLFVGALTPKFQDILFALLNITDLPHDPRLGGRRELLFSPDNRDWVRARIAQAFLTRDRDEWLAQLAAHDCPASEIAPAWSWLDHPQVVSLGQRHELRDPLCGPVIMPGTPLTLSDTPVRAPTPRRIADSATWLPRHINLNLGPAPTADHRTGVGPLAGLRVINLGTVLAGPFAGLLLAELGAEVTKVEPLAGDPFGLRGHQNNRGLRSLAMNLADENAHDAFMSMVNQADVVIDNFRPGVLDRLRIDFPSLARSNPRIICASISGFGSTGPLGGRPGVDPVLQAASGLMAAQGGSDEPVFITVALNDVAAAGFTVLGITAAVYARQRTGNGQQVSTTLAETSCFVQCGELVASANGRVVPVGGRDHPGPSHSSRYFETSDGFVRIHADSAKIFADAGLISCPRKVEQEILSPNCDEDGSLGHESAILLDRAFLTQTASEVIARIHAAGGAAIVARTYRDLVQDESVREDGRFVEIRWPDGRVALMPGRYASFSRTPETRTFTAPGVGEHSIEVLSSYGISSSLINELVNRGQVYLGSSIYSVANVGYR